MGRPNHRLLREILVPKANLKVFSDESITFTTAPILEQMARLVLESDGE